MLLNDQISFSHCICEKSFKSEIKREEIKWQMPRAVARFGI